MLKKSHALALAVTTAGLIGLSAPMASAATTAFGHGPGGSLANVSHNQVPVQACGNNVNLNAAGGQLVGEGDALVGSLGSPGSLTNATEVSNRGCTMVNNQHEGRDSDGNSVVNVTNNQVPVQACGNDINGNLLGLQGVVSDAAGALSLGSPGSVTNAQAFNNQGCVLVNNQG
ncbi:MAG: hypothetical protein ACRDOI_20410 [Trebonia sp.]